MYLIKIVKTKTETGRNWEIVMEIYFGFLNKNIQRKFYYFSKTYLEMCNQ